jgi:hypothetical protein
VGDGKADTFHCSSKLKGMRKEFRRKDGGRQRSKEGIRKGEMGGGG